MYLTVLTESPGEEGGRGGSGVGVMRARRSRAGGATQRRGVDEHQRRAARQPHAARAAARAARRLAGPAPDTSTRIKYEQSINSFYLRSHFKVYDILDIPISLLPANLST